MTITKGYKCTECDHIGNYTLPNMSAVPYECENCHAPGKLEREFGRGNAPNIGSKCSGDNTHSHRVMQGLAIELDVVKKEVLSAKKVILEVTTSDSKRTNSSPLN